MEDFKLRRLSMGWVLPASLTSDPPSHSLTSTRLPEIWENNLFLGQLVLCLEAMAVKRMFESLPSERDRNMSEKTTRKNWWIALKTLPSPFVNGQRCEDSPGPGAPVLAAVDLPGSPGLSLGGDLAGGGMSGEVSGASGSSKSGVGVGGSRLNSAGKKTGSRYGDASRGTAHDAPRPYFEDVGSRNVSAVVGQTAVLRCRVKHLAEQKWTLRSVRAEYVKVRLPGPERASEEQSRGQKHRHAATCCMSLETRVCLFQSNTLKSLLGFSGAADNADMRGQRTGRRKPRS
ncbi:hypothetical protein FOCC_FOCC005896 [Frankliniella occidentalis]|nr:hypothetical protein FOCC_FOCC005896 [Frankliniella occidentalis]